MNERLDVLLSARRDGALTPAEQAELDRILSESEVARRRALELDRVDEGLRALAASPVDGERLARNLAAVRQRSALERAASRSVPLATAATLPTPARSGSAATTRGSSDAGARRARALGVGLGAAAIAAAWIAALVFPIERPTGEAAGGPRDASESREMGWAEEGRAVAVPGVERVAAEDLAALGLEEPGDLEVIDELELLDFLADRERTARGPRG
jgi:anti-sigma factor RsiW